LWLWFWSANPFNLRGHSSVLQGINAHIIRNGGFRALDLSWFPAFPGVYYAVAVNCFSIQPGPFEEHLETRAGGQREQLAASCSILVPRESGGARQPEHLNARTAWRIPLHLPHSDANHPLESAGRSIGSEGQLHACVSAGQGERAPIQVVARDLQQCLKVGALNEVNSNATGHLRVG
jgi:hypothetical protein